jgi:hypothetical protein
MSLPYFKLTSEDETVIRKYLATTPDSYVNFSSLMYYKWGQRWLVKEEVEKQLELMKMSFCDSARKVAIAMCLSKAYGTKYGKKFSEKEKEGFYFVQRIFKPLANSPASNNLHKAEFYDSSFWASPVVLIWTINEVDRWFECNIQEIDSYCAFVVEQIDEILGPHPRTDPDYP